MDTHQNLHMVLFSPQLPPHGISPHTVVLPFPRTNSGGSQDPGLAFQALKHHQDLHTEDRSTQHDLIHSLIYSLHIWTTAGCGTTACTAPSNSQGRERGESLPDVAYLRTEVSFFCFAFLFICSSVLMVYLAFIC